MRALFGLDPDGASRGVDVAHAFEEGLGFYARDYFLQTMRGPGTPFWRMQRARRELDDVIFGEIARRRQSGERGDDLLSLLLDATDEDGGHLDDQHIRDEVMTLLFAGHDTTTSTVTFMFHELDRNPEVRAWLQEEIDEELGAGGLRPEHLGGTALPRLEMAVDETLRMYPPAWVGPRRSVAPFTFAGREVPGDVPVNYSSWASHHIAHVFPEPDALPARALHARGEGRSCPRARTCRSAAGRGRASGCASARSRCARSPRCSFTAACSRSRTATRCASARCRRSARATGLPVRIAAA